MGSNRPVSSDEAQMTVALGAGAWAPSRHACAGPKLEGSAGPCGPHAEPGSSGPCPPRSPSPGTLPRPPCCGGAGARPFQRQPGMCVCVVVWGGRPVPTDSCRPKLAAAWLSIGDCGKCGVSGPHRAGARTRRAGRVSQRVALIPAQAGRGGCALSLASHPLCPSPQSLLQDPPLSQSRASTSTPGLRPPRLVHACGAQVKSGAEGQVRRACGHRLRLPSSSVPSGVRGAYLCCFRSVPWGHRGSGPPKWPVPGWGWGQPWQTLASFRLQIHKIRNRNRENKVTKCVVYLKYFHLAN